MIKIIMEVWILLHSYIQTCVESYLIGFLKLGKIPQHVAFIMDGNRRYARKKSLQPHQGHAFGFEQLHQTLDWSMKLGVKVVTVYAFSIDNFKRSQIEIDTIFDLAERKFDEFLKEDALIQKHGICVKLIGNLELLRQTTKDAAYKLMWNTRNNVNATLYIACPYTSIEEMNTVLGGIYQNLQQTNIGISDITREFIGKCLYTKEPLDLLIRTSGEVRLSDFMLWVSNGCTVHFIQTLWPEFTLFDMLPILISYQFRSKELNIMRTDSISNLSEKTQKYLNDLHSERIRCCQPSNSNH
ncbi:putative undecaprenyl diphosphate synthase-domain-containing protein [Globomyces pollinis-pini]|nr:putative undecaprenyl diphosphate synthase-domain-containing protein [Globomyces pollinis-pini]